MPGITGLKFLTASVHMEPNFRAFELFLTILDGGKFLIGSLLR